MRITKNFLLQEFVHETIFTKIGNRSIDFINPLLPTVCQRLRETFGPIIINDWAFDGAYLNSGLRMPGGTVGARLSAHRFGTAVDLKFKDVTPIEVQQVLLDRYPDHPYITRMENAATTKTWLHLEVGTRREGIIVFEPPGLNDEINR